ncbi:hypothetical protein ACEYW6_29425 [Nostoc sp. UIC 10607]|uniref:hypothetical protein n=1 Tax=Nostoc sp. UIC 10607 TaxID=3045935 RepID=UPI0039A016CD
MADKSTQQANLAQKVYVSTTVLSGLLLVTSVGLESMDKVSQGTTTGLTKVAVVMMDKTKKMSQDANRRMLEEALKNTKRPPNWPLD